MSFRPSKRKNIGSVKQEVVQEDDIATSKRGRRRGRDEDVDDVVDGEGSEEEGEDEEGEDDDEELDEEEQLIVSKLHLPEAASQLSPSEIEVIINKVTRFCLLSNQTGGHKGSIISRDDISKYCIPHKAKKAIDYIIGVVRIKLRRIFGFDLRQLLSEKGVEMKYYALVHKSKDSEELSDRSHMFSEPALEDLGKLMYMLGVIYFENNHISTHAFWKQLDAIGLTKKYNKKLFSRFLKEKYIEETREKDHALDVFTTFYSIGPRTDAEMNRIQIHKFFSEQVLGKHVDTETLTILEKEEKMRREDVRKKLEENEQREREEKRRKASKKNQSRKSKQDA